MVRLDGAGRGRSWVNSLIASLREGGRNQPGLGLTVVAAEGSSSGLPQISIDRAQFGGISGDVDALLHQSLVMAGGWRDYEVVHCLAEAPGACQLHLAAGGRLIYSPPRAADPSLLSALARLGRAWGEDVTQPVAVEQAWHPVDPVAYSFRAQASDDLFAAGQVAPRGSRHAWRTVGGPGALAGEAPRLVLAPADADRFTHLRWLVHSLACGAIYLHDCSDLAAPFWPEGSVVRRTGALYAQVDMLRSSPADREAMRRWALSYCAPAATAARLRRIYTRMRAA